MIGRLFQRLQPGKIGELAPTPNDNSDFMGLLGITRKPYFENFSILFLMHDIAKNETSLVSSLLLNRFSQNFQKYSIHGDFLLIFGPYLYVQMSHLGR